MNYEQLQTLREWCVLQMRIAQTRADPIDRMSVNESNITKTVGYRDTRTFIGKLSPRRRRMMIAWMRSHVVGVRELMARAAVTGEELSLADLTIEIRDAATGEPIGSALVSEPDECKGVGAPTMHRLVEVDGNNRRYIQCPACLQRWFVADVLFTIPSHPPVTA